MCVMHSNGGLSVPVVGVAVLRGLAWLTDGGEGRSSFCRAGGATDCESLALMLPCILTGLQIAAWWGKQLIRTHRMLCPQSVSFSLRSLLFVIEREGLPEN